MGRWCWDQVNQEEFVVVEQVVPALHVRQGSTFLTFTHDSQVDLYDIMEKRYPSKDLVGWFHTHPRMGVFLSGYDIWLHEHFFPRAWQVALVVEPHSTVGGFFIRDQDHNLDPRRYYGFYELSSDPERSVVHWRNLNSEEPVPETLKEDQGL